jgi:hypothetical protein
MFGRQPNVVDPPGTTPFTPSPGVPLAGLPGLGAATLGTIDYYGGSGSAYKGLLFKPEDAPGDPPAAGGPFQTMYVPYNYTFGTDPIRLTIVARQQANWNNFHFGFVDTDGNLSNMLGLFDNLNNPTNPRTRFQLTHNAVRSGTFQSRIFQNNTFQVGNTPVNSHVWQEFVLEYDPTKVNQVGVNPYTFSYGEPGGPRITHALNTVPNATTSDPTPTDLGLGPMSNNGNTGPSSIYGIGWGFWNSDANIFDRSVLVQSVKLEILSDAEEQPGDHNGDGVVDAADYVDWRKNGPPGGYEEWVANFGESGPGGGGAGPVPEPASTALLVFGTMTAGLIRRGRPH